MGFANAIRFSLIAAGLIFAARPVSDWVDRTITKLRGRRNAGIHLSGDDDGPAKKPFPRLGLVIVRNLAILGLLGQVFMIMTGIRVRYHHYGDEKRIWWFIQIAYIIVHHVLLLLALTYPAQLIVKATFTFPPTKPLFKLKRSRVANANPGALLQTLSLIIFALPFIAGLQAYTWYNWFYWRNAHFNRATFSGVIQQLIALVLFIYATVARQVYGDMEEEEDAERRSEQTSTVVTPAPASPAAGPST